LGTQHFLSNNNTQIFIFYIRNSQITLSVLA
jgi:hypothetical protein